MEVKVITKSDREIFEREVNKIIKGAKQIHKVKFATSNTNAWLFYSALIIYS